MNNFWQQHFPEKWVIDGFYPELLTHIMKFQRWRIDKLKDPNPLFLLVLEDLAAETILRYAEEIRQLAYKGRHYKICLFILTQYPYAIPPGVRDNADYIVAFHQKGWRSRKALQEQYGSDLGAKGDDFLQVMDSYTSQEFVVIVIDNTTRHFGWIEEVFWDKADDPGRFRVGCENFWRDTNWDVQLQKFPLTDPMTVDDAKKNLNANRYNDDKYMKLMEKAKYYSRKGPLWED